MMSKERESIKALISLCPVLSPLSGVISDAGIVLEDKLSSNCGCLALLFLFLLLLLLAVWLQCVQCWLEPCSLKGRQLSGTVNQTQGFCFFLLAAYSPDCVSVSTLVSFLNVESRFIRWVAKRDNMSC